MKKPEKKAWFMHGIGYRRTRTVETQEVALSKGRDEGERMELMWHDESG